MKDPLIELEGTTLEGGGQLLRIATGLAALTALPIQIQNIRGKRSSGGGLKGQHLSAVNWLGWACGATLEGNKRGSKTLLFRPSTERHTRPDLAQRTLPNGTRVLELRIEQSTTGAIALVLQAILPYLFFAGHTFSPLSVDPCSPLPIYLTITGGTNVTFSPSLDYLNAVLFPVLERIGLPPVQTTIHKRGWCHGPSDVGCVSFLLTPLPRGTRLPAFSLLTRGRVVKIEAYVLAPMGMEGMFLSPLREALRRWMPGLGFGEEDRVELEMCYEASGHSKRLYLLLVAVTDKGWRLGRDWLYDKKIGEGRKDGVSKAVNELVEGVVRDLGKELEHGACVDEYLRDQLVVYQALAEGKSHVFGGEDQEGQLVKGSLHFQTARWVVNEVLDLGFDEEGSCQGLGLAAGEVYADREADTDTEARSTG